MAKTYRVYLGTEPSVDITPGETFRLAKLTMAERRLARAVGGYTRYETRGAWVNPNGDIVEEPGLVYEVVTDNSNAVQAFAIAAKVALYQEAVILSTTESEYWEL